jgi:hypothetical protein
MNENFDDRLDRAAQQLRKEISPGRDLWPGIEKAIAEPRRSRWTPRLAQAAAAALLIGASSWVTYLVVDGEDTPTVAVAPELVFETAAFGGNYHLGPGFQDARDSLRAELDAEFTRLGPDAQTDIEASIGVIHAAIVEINGALERDPGNVMLQQKLLRAYREELNVLRRVGNLTRNVMTRNDI